MRISDWRSDVCSSDLPIFRKEFERAIVLPPGPPLRAERRRRRMVAHHIFTPALALAASALAFSTPASAQVLGGSGGLGVGFGGKNGRASCWERGCHYVTFLVVAKLFITKMSLLRYTHFITSPIISKLLILNF